ncbi:TPA: transcriptional regulator [Candidatus Bathyarchaeota archaeon]|nr:transcriptional regulator [Candidatus Bathyarchaeota archaeon]
MPKRNNLEQDALQIIIDMGSKGVLQSELWRKINASSREGSRISIKLESKGLIYRERELHNGRWTYRLFSKRRPISIDSIITCPCLTCAESSKCESGGTISPNNCDRLTQWILGSVEGKNPPGE